VEVTLCLCGEIVKRRIARQLRSRYPTWRFLPTSMIGSEGIASVITLRGVLLDYLPRIFVVSRSSKLCMAQVVDLRFIPQPFMT